MDHARLQNLTGGNKVNPTRFNCIHAIGRRAWVLQDVSPLLDYLKTFGGSEASRCECFVVDVVIPSYHVDVIFLREICSLTVPDGFRTTFMVIIDNPTKLAGLMAKSEPPRWGSGP
jgi:hypothetical protein